MQPTSPNLQPRPFRRALGHALIAALALSVSACATAPDAAGDATARSTSPSTGVVQAVRTVQVTPEKAENGKAVFMGCVGCHGMSGEGSVGTGPRLNSSSFMAAAGDDFLIKTITDGRAGTTMIPWGASYSPEQIESIVAYLRTQTPTEPVMLNEAALSGNIDNGSELFRSICSSCHGRSGAGYMETANGTGIGRTAFLSVASNGYLRYIIKHGKSQTQMRPFAEESKVAVANLTDQEIEDVIAYLRSHAW